MSHSKKRARMDVRRMLGLALAKPNEVVSMGADDLDLMLRVLRRVRLLGWLAARLKQTGDFDQLPVTAKDQLESALVLAESRARLAKWELNRIAWALENTPDVPLVAMKGCAYLLLDLPNAVGRLFADVDLMTTEDELEAVEARLNAQRWVSTKLTPYDQNYYRKWTHELPPLIHEEREVEIDLHHNIVPLTARLKPSSEKLLSRSRQLAGSRYQVLADEDIVLHAMTHLMFDSDLADKLRDLVDIGELLEAFSNNDAQFWEKLFNRAVELDLTRPAYYSLRYAHMLMETSVPGHVLGSSEGWAPPGFVVALMDRLVPRALYPQHPDHPSKVTAFCRQLLYIRSHWIRMPPWLLAYHLGYKFLITRIGWRWSNQAE